MLKTMKNCRDGKMVLALEGRLDTITAPELETELLGSLSGVKDLTLDFEKLDYISSAGLRILLLTQKAMNAQGQMKLIHVREPIMEILETTGFSTILTIE